MKTTSISTQALQNISRQAIASAQRDLAQATAELSTGRHADPGLELGFRSSAPVTLRSEQSRIDIIQDTNSLLSRRLEVSQQAFDTLAASAGDFFGTLLGPGESPTGPSIIARAGGQTLDTLTGLLNTEFAGDYIFAGLNTGQTPFDTPILAAGSPAKTALDAAFLAEFGFTQDDPAVAGLTGAQMQTFLDGAFQGLFEDPAWEANWSNATADLRDVRIAPNAQIEVGVSAHDTAIRDLVRASVMVTALGGEAMPQETYGVIVEASITATKKGLDGITALKSEIGLQEARITRENERLDLQSDLITEQLSVLEEVDPFDAATRANSLLTRIETSYELTSRLQQLSLLRFI